MNATEALWDEHIKHVLEANYDNTASKEHLDRVLRSAVEAGVPFTELGIALNRSEAAIRQRADRLGWYVAGSRKYKS